MTRRWRIATTCAGVLPGQKMASAPPARSARCKSTFAKPRSAYGRSRSRAIASSAVMRPPPTASSSARSRSLSIAPPPLQEQVRRAGLEAGEVDGDVDVAQLAEAGDDHLVPPVLPQPRHLIAADLQSRQPVVVTHAELAEAEGPHEGLGGVDLAQLLRGDAIAVLESRGQARSEEHTSELQSRLHLVCRLLLEKKKNTKIIITNTIISLRRKNN